ncbi:MAG: hypothetical protein MMC33_008303, partial [Icmadophila ericetorum]|nr:hypothetical protein [Icmadophila ericetorum]
NASARVRRAKSTQSIKPRPLPLGITRVDAETARRHAIAAASEAFDRANRRTVLGPVDATRAADTHQKSIWRNESVRFTGPTAVRLDQRPITRTTVAPQAPVSGSGHSQTVSEGSHVSQYPDPFVTALPQVESIPSTPSSYRKLKKAKSMVTTQRLVVKLVAIRLLTEQRAPDASRARAPLPVHNPNLPSVRPQEYNYDAAIHQARETFLSQLEQQRLKARPSILGFGKTRTQKAFRKTVRNSSANSYGSAVGSMQPVIEKNSKSKVKGYSASIRNRLRSVFSRGSSTRGLPSQQVEANRPHFGDYISGPNVLDYTDPIPYADPTVPIPDGDLLRRVSSRGTSPHRMPVHLPHPSRAGSIRSVLSNDGISNGKSRVTSWTDSTVESSLTREQLLEKKRLSIIQENGGPHQPSSSFGAAPRRGFFSHPSNVGSTRSRRDSASITSQRIFSALQKKLDQHNQKHAHDEYFVNGDHTEGEMAAELLPRNLASIPERFSTIRMLPESSGHGSISSRRVRYSNSVNFQLAAPDSSNQVQDNHRLNRKPSFQEIARYNEEREMLKRSPKPLREVKSAFFPPSSEYQTRSLSPYRQALRSSNIDRELAEVQEELNERLPKLTSPFYSANRNESSIASHSAYSRTTGGNSGYESTFSLDHSQSTGEPGTALIITKSPDRPTTPRFSREATSSHSSGEMRGWMASEVAKLENLSVDNIKIHEDYTARDSRHRRETAQTHSDETDEIIQEDLNRLPKEPTHVRRNGSLSKSILRHKTSDQMIEKFPLRFPLIERNNSSMPNAGERRPSLISQRSGAVRRYTSNLENQKFPSTTLQRQPAIRRQTSAASIASQDSFAPAVVIKNVQMGKSLLQGAYGTEESSSPRSNIIGQSRHSPERAARLRRMRSSVGIIDSKGNSGSKEHSVSPESPRYGYEASKGTITGHNPPSSPLTARNLASNQSRSPGGGHGGSQVMVNRFLTTRMQSSPVGGGPVTPSAFI